MEDQPEKSNNRLRKGDQKCFAKSIPGHQNSQLLVSLLPGASKKCKENQRVPKVYQKHDAASRIYRKLMCLPLMRADNIPAAFKLIKEEALHLNKTKFAPFLSYIEEQWLKREGPQSISVYMESERTNNPMESYNSTLNFKIPAKGCFYKFVSLLRVEEFIKSREYAIIMNGGTQLYHKQKKSYRDKNEKILSIQKQFENGKINLKEFFDKSADLYEDDFNQEDDNGDTDDEDSTNHKNDVLYEKCEMCHLRLKDTMFEPCFDLKYCAECAESMQKCPVCDVQVARRLHVFLWYYFSPQMLSTSFAYIFIFRLATAQEGTAGCRIQLQRTIRIVLTLSSPFQHFHFH